MFDPLNRLKLLPWIPLLQAALVTVLIAIAIDQGIIMLLLFPSTSNALRQLFNSPVGDLLSLAIPVGIGALAAVVLERGFQKVMITAASLWALVACLGLWLAIADVLPLRSLLLPGLDLIPLVLVAVGMFWKARRHWRWR
jgi:hypothetical protein